MLKPFIFSLYDFFITMLPVIKRDWYLIAWYIIQEFLVVNLYCCMDIEISVFNILNFYVIRF